MKQNLAIDIQQPLTEQQADKIVNYVSSQTTNVQGGWMEKDGAWQLFFLIEPQQEKVVRTIVQTALKEL